MSKVIIIGGGAAGMFAALGAVDAGHQVTILEQNEKLGKKIYITGKGRCNLTNACETSEIFENIPTNAKFLYSAIYGYDNFRVIDFFEEHGMPTKTERGNRVFPVSDHSSDVIATLQRTLKNKGVTVRLHTKAEHLEIEEGKVRGVKTSNGTTCPADAVIIATGGYSYQTTGSTGDGYRFAKKSGHTIAPLSPSLVPMTVKEDYCMQMQGLSLKNVEVKIKDGKKVLFEEFGEMLFTHFGVSGPLILSASSVVNDKIRKELSADDIQKIFNNLIVKPIYVIDKIPKNESIRLFDNPDIYEAEDENGRKFRIITTIVGGGNYARVLHGMTNAFELKKLYETGNEHYWYYNFIIAKNEALVEKIMEHMGKTKVRKLFADHSIQTAVCYLNEDQNINIAKANFDI